MKCIVKYSLSLIFSICISAAFFPNTPVFAGNNNIETVTLQLKWTHQFQFAGYYAAIEKGYYRDEGLEVVMKEGKLGIVSADEVINGNADFAVDTTNIIMHRDHGAPIVVLADIFQHSPNILITRKDSEITSPQNLKSKKIMLDKNSSPEILAMLQNEGLNLNDINFVSHSWDLNDLITKKVDAYNAYTTTEPFDLQKKGIEYGILNPINYGIDFYGDILFTSEKQIKNNPQKVEKFLRASLKGWEYAMKNQDEIITLILTKYNPTLSREKLKFEASEMEKIIMPAYVELGHISPSRWERIAETYQKLGLVSRNFSMQGFLYDPENDKSKYYLQMSWYLLITIGILLMGLLLIFSFNNKLKATVKEKTKDLQDKIQELNCRNDELNITKEELEKLNSELESKVLERTKELQYSYEELESFSYSVSHDLRAPLRSMSGFSNILLNDYFDTLDKDAKHFLNRIVEASNEMGLLIDELLNMSQLSRKKMCYEPVDLSSIVQSYAAEFKESNPERAVSFIIEQGIEVIGDKILLQTTLFNLLSNAWKYTSVHKSAVIQFGAFMSNGKRIYFVKDDGAGFDMKYAGNLFKPFYRLHDKSEFDGIGIGLSNVKRIIQKHGGSIWANSSIEMGATFFFTLGQA